ncbi:iron-containing alcohol dehydrogenase [Peribacillus kribbensis]|uniref:iron-containing alcohol dehydrogenase n=1 Tax=Peribacillus kribbensis TaxID=356658 RepID=UPI0004112622
MAQLRYCRETGALSQSGVFIEKFGKSAVLIGGNISRETVEGELRKSLSEKGIWLEKTLWYGGESSASNISRLEQQLSSASFDVLIAAGGGKAIDTVKALAHRLNKPLVAIPTIAATCAAATAISILYSDEGEF